MSIALITPTKNREEQLALVIECMNRQTVLPDTWVIVDDGRDPVPEEVLSKSVVPIKYIHYRSGVGNSMRANSAKCLEEASADKYIFVDDDDYYPRNYVENFSRVLDSIGDNEMAGNGRWIDYRLSTGYWRERLKTQEEVDAGQAKGMTEWHRSGIKGEELKKDMIEVLRSPDCSCLSNDSTCYRTLFRNKKRLNHVFDFGDWGDTSLKGYDVGGRGFLHVHRSNDGLIRDDDNFSFFKQRLGEDWKRYEKYLGRLRDK